MEELADEVHDLQRIATREAGVAVERRDGVHARDGYVLHVEDLSPERRTHILDGYPPRATAFRADRGRRGDRSAGR